MLPLGCFPLWGRVGVILQAAVENKRIETKEDFNRAGILPLQKTPFFIRYKVLPGTWNFLFIKFPTIMFI